MRSQPLSPLIVGFHTFSDAEDLAARQLSEQNPFMPIKPEQRGLYPFDWRLLSASIRFRRAKGRCERCGRPHGQFVAHLSDGRWWDDAGNVWRDGRGRRLQNRPPPPFALAHLPRTRVILACAHIDHDPTNNRGRNLLALCQRCHLNHDRQDNWWRRWRTLRSRRAVADLSSAHTERACNDLPALCQAASKLHSSARAGIARRRRVLRLQALEALPAELPSRSARQASDRP